MAVKRESGRGGKIYTGQLSSLLLIRLQLSWEAFTFFLFLRNIVGAKNFTVVKGKYILVECIYADSLKRDVAFLNKGQKENKSLQVVINFIRVCERRFFFKDCLRENCGRTA